MKYAARCSLAVIDCKLRHPQHVITLLLNFIGRTRDWMWSSLYSKAVSSVISQSCYFIHGFGKKTHNFQKFLFAKSNATGKFGIWNQHVVSFLHSALIRSPRSLQEILHKNNMWFILVTVFWEGVSHLACSIVWTGRIHVNPQSRWFVIRVRATTD